MRRLLGLPHRTWSEWRRRLRFHGATHRRPGPRPRWSASVAREAERLLLHLGLRTGVERLKASMPAASRRELARLKSKVKERHERRTRILVRELRWCRARRVWAADFSDAPRRIDGVFPFVLYVRDLASHRPLACVPAARKTSAFVRRVLAGMFDRLGAPLVLKTDNGSEFKGEVARLLEERDVAALKGPGETPRFNGAVEASIAWLESWTLHAAAREGAADRWSSSAVEEARVLAERTMRPWGRRGPTPLVAWRRERGVSATERRAFLGQAELLGVEGALVKRGLLEYRSRWVRKAPWLRRNRKGARR